LAMEAPKITRCACRHAMLHRPRHAVLRRANNDRKMKPALRRFGRRLLARVRPVVDAVAGWFVASILKLIRHFDRLWISDAAARFMRGIGPRLQEHQIGRDNLRAAFPEKSSEEIEAILESVWDNLGRVGAEFAQLDRLCGKEGEEWPYVEYSPDIKARFMRLRDDGKPALVFAAHLANWELPAVIAAKNGLDTMVLYRRPNIGAVADAVIDIRQGIMGTLVPTNFDAPVRLARALSEGRHVAMLVDQHYVNGAEVTFFGRRCLANPLIAMLARQVECPIHGTRVIRLDRHRFRAEVTEAIEPARDGSGRVDVRGTMQVITSVIEGWVREYPEQWLWLHRRWRER
jgi:Kdo2-lipid IVA lauroyltransferase/acyltransferase